MKKAYHATIVYSVSTSLQELTVCGTVKLLKIYNIVPVIRKMQIIIYKTHTTIPVIKLNFPLFGCSMYTLEN